MNQSLMNPEIVTRAAQERERAMRREILDLHEFASESAKSPAPTARAQKSRTHTILAWVAAILAR